MTSKPVAPTRSADGRFYACALCDDSGADWIEAGFDFPVHGYVYHRACVEYRRDNPNNSREARGMANTLALGKPIRQGRAERMTTTSEVKCDDCKETIRETDSMIESVAGGICDQCRRNIAYASKRVKLNILMIKCGGYDVSDQDIADLDGLINLFGQREQEALRRAAAAAHA
jgi:hypothetical protein